MTETQIPAALIADAKKALANSLERLAQPDFLPEFKAVRGITDRQPCEPDAAKVLMELIALGPRPALYVLALIDCAVQAVAITGLEKGTGQ